MGIGDFISDITPDSVEDAVEDATEWAGNRVEDAGNWTADRLDDVGWESGADWVREKSRSVANRMGAEVDEMDLGQTEDKTKLIYGSPGKLRSTATHLRAFQKAFNDVGLGLEGLDSESLKGQAADAFRGSVKVQPPKWYKGADAFEDAAKALEAFAETVTWAQGQAQQAIDKWKEGTKASEDAADAHKKKVDDYNKAVGQYNAQPADKRDPSQLPPKPGETFPDPGEARRKEAQDLVTEARRQRNAAAETARSAITLARDAAPPKPSYAEQASDGLDELEIMKTHFGGGIIKGTAGLLNFARGLNPMDPYNLTHPAEYAMSLNSTAAGLVQVANDPWGAGKQMLGDFMKDPAEGFGRLIPDVALTVATGGAGAGVKGARVAEELADAANAARRAEGLEDAGSGARRAEDAADPSRPPKVKCSGREPVDFATGRMFMPQVDVSLPGSLPLDFRRDFESSYRAGHWFGPSWSSTIDQRLTVDAIGVVFHGENNLLLSFPHPAPGVPVLPEAGPRYPLERHADGSYTLTDSESGLQRHFLAPPGDEPGGDGTAPLNEITDRCGRTVRAEYDEHGNPLALSHSGGYRLEFSTENGRITALRSAGNELVRYGYTDGHLTEITRSSGVPTRFEYDAEGRILAWTDTNHSRYTFVYDDQDRCVSQTGVEAHLASEFHYSEPSPDTGLSTTTVTDSLGHTWRYTVNHRCQVIAETDPTGATTYTTQDRYNRVVSRTDARGARTEFAYDDAGHLLNVTRPDGSVQRASYDGLGLPVALDLPGGARWRQEFDERGLRTSVTDPADRTTRYTYDERGHLTSVTDPLGAVTRLRHDAAGLLLERGDPVGGVTAYRRDALGRIVERTAPGGESTYYDWTAEGHPARVTHPDGSTEHWLYDGEGNCLSHTDALGATTRFEYTHFDLLAARSDPDGTRHEFVHDTELRLTSVTNSLGLSWGYRYDEAGRLTEETDFDGRTTRYEVDPLGHVAARTTPLGATIRYERDEMGRVVRKEAAGAVTSYTYDPAGRLLQAVGPDGELTYQYDRSGRVKTELSDGRPLAFAYDAAGRRTRRVTPGGQVTVYAHDTAGRTVRLTTGGHEVTFTRDEAGQELSRTFGEALSLTSSWDEAGRITGQEVAYGERSVSRRSYTYDLNGHLAGTDDTVRGPRRFALDPVGRVTDVTGDRWSETYAYGHGGGGTTAARWPDTHAGADAQGERVYEGTRIMGAGANRYVYDRAGRLVRRTRTRLSRKPDVWQYSYDAEDRLVSVTTPDGTVWRYRYDPLGRRTAKERLAADGDRVVERTEFVWDGPVLAEQSTAPTGQVPHRTTLTWDYDGLAPVTQTERLIDAATQDEIDARFFAVATDLIGTPTELIDEQGRIAWHSRTTLWGITTWNATATAYTPLRFPGQYFDPETGLHYNHHRYYDPRTARYVTPDPLGLAPAPDPAGYVHNPHTTSDPLGLAPYENNGGLGDLVKVNKPDPAADALAERLGGESRVKFEHDPKGREIDAISDDYVAQSKPGGMQMGSALRNQAKATFEYGIQSGRTPYFHFDGEPGPGVIAKLQEYGRRYGIEPVIDTTPL
ncbi:putative T7SS-secreted protein [Streptomyces sp. NPDC058371]|uniref:putative T7SS-secreted protein n=1 Tax=Streptomyces sp. NPDC058371 TaxID=3346463 RepID=UPI0036533AD9